MYRAIASSRANDSPGWFRSGSTRHFLRPCSSTVSTSGKPACWNDSRSRRIVFSLTPISSTISLMVAAVMPTGEHSQDDPLPNEGGFFGHGRTPVAAGDFGPLPEHSRSRVGFQRSSARCFCSCSRTRRRLARSVAAEICHVGIVNFTGRQGRQPNRCCRTGVQTRSRWSLDITKRFTVFWFGSTEYRRPWSDSDQSASVFLEDSTNSPCCPSPQTGSDRWRGDRPGAFRSCTRSRSTSRRNGTIFSWEVYDERRLRETGSAPRRA